MLLLFIEEFFLRTFNFQINIIYYSKDSVKKLKIYGNTKPWYFKTFSYSLKMPIGLGVSTTSMVIIFE